MFDRVRLCSIVELFDYRTFDCIQLAKFFCEFDSLSSITDPNQTQSSNWVRLGLITECSIDYVGITLYEINSRYAYVYITQAKFITKPCHDIKY